MKKLFLFCLFFIGFVLATVNISVNKASAQQAAACSTFSTSPSPVTNDANSVTFTMGPTDQNATYEIEVDINKDTIGTCAVNVRSPQIQGTGGAISHQFTKNNEKCFDRLVALEPDAFNLIHLRRVDRADRPVQCTNGYRAASTCRLDFSPRNIDTSTPVFIEGMSVPGGMTTIGVRINGDPPNVAQAIVTNGSFLQNIGTLPTAREYQIDLVRIIDVGQYERISACPALTLTVGQPGQPAQNQPPSSSTPLTPINTQGRCAAGQIDTAIGCIPYGDTNSFVGWFLKWAIGIAGGIAFLMIIFSGFQIMTSSNNPQQLQTGRELLTAAVSGLILIIFSAFLLKLIGVDILGIPGL